MSRHYPGDQWPGEQGYGYSQDQGYPEDYGQPGDPRRQDPRRGDPRDGRGRRDGGVWDADAPLPPAASRDAAWDERSLPPRGGARRGGPPQGGAPQGGAPQGSGPQRVQPGRESFRSGPNRVQPSDPSFRSGSQPVQPGGAAGRGATRRSASQYGPPGGFQTGGDYPDGDLVPGLADPQGDRGYGRDRDRSPDDWRGDRRDDPRRGPVRDRYGDGGRYPGGRQARDDRYAEGDRYRDDQYRDDQYGDDQYGDDGFEAGRRGGSRTGDGRRGGEPRGGDRARYDDDRARYDDSEDRQPRRRGRIRRLAPWIALGIIVIFLIPLVGGGLYAYHYIQAKDHPPDYVGGGIGPQVLVQVQSGDTADSLAPLLVQDGVVKSAAAFTKAAEASTNPADIEAGYFLLNRQMQASLAYAYLDNPKNVVQHGVTLPEGLRVSDTLLRLSKDTGIPLATFQAVLKNQLSQLALPTYANGDAEGYLFPATYPITPHETPLAILQAMVNRFAQEATYVNLPASVTESANGGTVKMSEGQIIIAASLVQAEAGRDQDMSKIAEVIYNRLAIGMPLKFDSTVFYGLGKYGTSATDAEINTPGRYNTYLNKGLTPTPIDSPGDAAIQAALHPATGNLLYFYGCPGGTTIFSATQVPSPSSC
jgi:UPF0755 protein